MSTRTDTIFPYTTLFRSEVHRVNGAASPHRLARLPVPRPRPGGSTHCRLLPRKVRRELVRLGGTGAVVSGHRGVAPVPDRQSTADAPIRDRLEPPARRQYEARTSDVEGKRVAERCEFGDRR